MRSKGGPISYSDIAKKHSQIAPNILHKKLDLEPNSDTTLHKNENGSKENCCRQYSTAKIVLETNGDLRPNPNQNTMDDMTINDENGNKDKTVASTDFSKFKTNSSRNYDITINTSLDNTYLRSNGCNVDSDNERESKDGA